MAALEKTLVYTDVVAQTVKRRFQGQAARINAIIILDAGETFYQQATIEQCGFGMVDLDHQNQFSF
jgi:hypothetical protein